METTAKSLCIHTTTDPTGSCIARERAVEHGDSRPGAKYISNIVESATSSARIAIDGSGRDGRNSGCIDAATVAAGGSASRLIARNCAGRDRQRPIIINTTTISAAGRIIGNGIGRQERGGGWAGAFGLDPATVTRGCVAGNCTVVNGQCSVQL